MHHTTPRRPTRPVPPTPTEQHPLSVNNPVVLDKPLSDEPSEDSPRDPATSLTPLRAHYLKKSLIRLQFNCELDVVTTAAPSNISALSYLGPPFSQPPKDAPLLNLPFLRYIFRQYVLTFPFMAAAPKDFYSEKLQPFISSLLSRNLYPTSVLDDSSEGSDQAAQVKILSKIERNLSLFLGAAIKLVEPEEVVRLSQLDLDRLETLAKKRQARGAKVKDIFEVNIVSIRTVTDRGRVRSRIHEEFIIRTRRSHHPDVFVSRRYGDFRTLADELRKAHPDESIRPVPGKDRSTVSAPANGSSISPTSQLMSQHETIQSNHNADSLQSPISQQSFAPSKLAREKNRLTLRSYLHSLMSSSIIASSPVLQSFLLSGPTTLSVEESEDAYRREEADKVRDDGRKRFAKEIASRVEGLRGAIRGVKGDIMGKDGLRQIFATIKTTSDVRNLPSNYQAVLEWARISLASTVFHHYVAADDASEMFSGLKRIHGLMPYFMMKTALKISNPIAMIRSVLDLFLAQPFGGRSLLQRMFTSSLTEEVKTLEEDIEAVKDKIDDPIMCEKIKQFVYAPREIQALLKADASRENLNLLAVVMRSGDEPVLSRPQMQRVVRAYHAHAVYMKTRESLADSDDDDGPQDDDAWLFEDFKVLTQIYSRLRDREQLIALIFEGVTAELLKDIITIFYSPLAQVYKAASIADSLGDLQNFVNDLIKTVEQVEEFSQDDPQRTVQAFIELIQRHEQAFYSFVHKVHSKGEGLFDSLMRWIELFLTVIREGLGDAISLEFLLPHTGQDRMDILREVDAVALYHYRMKVLYEDKLRRRFGKVHGRSQTEADAEDEATQALLSGVVGEISFGELIQGDVNDLAAQESDGESDDESSSEFESDDDESDESTEESIVEPKPISRSQTITSNHERRTSHLENPVMHPRARTLSLKSVTSSRHGHNAPPVPPVPKNMSHLALSKPLPPPPSTGPSKSHHNQISQKGTRKGPDILKHPELVHLQKLLPVFVEMMRPLLRPRAT